MARKKSLCLRKFISYAVIKVVTRDDTNTHAIFTTRLQSSHTVCYSYALGLRH